MCLPVLNLLNFELPSANKCRYVLTSPRSLKACRKAGIKPVDLLYKSLSDVEEEIGNKEEAHAFYEAYEAERQRKLAVCRALRNELLLHGYWGLNGQNELPYKTERPKRYSPKLRDSKERNLPAITGSYKVGRAETPENMRRVKEQTMTPRSYMNLPKVNMCIDNTGLENKDQENLGNTKDISNKELEDKKNLNDKASDNYVCVEKLMKDPTHPKLKGEANEFQAGEMNNNTQTQKINDLDIVPNTLHTKLGEGSDIEVINNYENNLIQDENYLASKDVNNNHVKIKSKRPNSVSRKKHKDSKKHLKDAEFKKAFQHMKIEYSDPDYCIYKYKQVIENSVERDLRELEVQRVQRELEAGMERWQDRVLLLQWLDMARASEQTSRELEMKVERLQQKNRAKNIIHTMNINKVKEAEDMKAEGLRRLVQEKERKIQNLHQEKERIIYESKSRALSIQELKDQIRSIMTPETFDQKVAKLQRHKKVLDSQMCARIMQRSHIWLG